MKTLTKIMCDAKAFPCLRLGQYFCNAYIKQPWPELFYEKDGAKSEKMIKDWLIDHQYCDEMPNKVIDL